MRARSVIWLVLLLLPLLATAFWLVERGSRLRDDPAEVLEALKAAQGPQLPAAEDAGALERTEPDRYDPETLYEFINGAAEGYIANGFETCLAAIYTYAGDIEVAAETYRFREKPGLLAQMEAELPASALPLPALPDARSDGSVLFAVHDRDLLKLTALAAGPETAAALESIATAWSTRGAS